MDIHELIRRKAAGAQYQLSEEGVIPIEEGDHHGNARSIIGEKMEELVIEIRKELLTAINEVLDQ